MSTKSQIDLKNVPRHVAIIMDGNGRWAKSKGEIRVFGHLNGVNGVREALTAATEVGVEYLTLYAFSSENWDRPKEEVAALMDLLVKTIIKELDELNKNDVRLKTIGETDLLPENCRQALDDAIRRTEKNSRITLILALSYGSRKEITKAVSAIAQSVKNGEIDPQNIDESVVQQNLETKEFPDPELLIRTSGEMRISNFLLWQIAYTELYFTETFWPDFKKEDFFKAVRAYQNRERRFGKISEQVTL